MPAYTPEQVRELRSGAQRWISDSMTLVRRVVEHPFAIPEARLIAVHGLSRRLAFIPHAIDRIFTEVPPDEVHPVPTAVTEITLHLQAASIHAFGAIDNLAQIWCAETHVTDKDGKALHHTQVGFGPKKAAVRASLPDDLRVYVEADAFKGWFEYLEAFRHAIAHRDPLYVPPRTMTAEDHEEYRRLEGELAKVATILDGRWYEIWGAMHSLGRFEPMMVPNLTDEIRPVYFHGQVICDLSTVVDLGNRVFDALDTRRAAQA